jgi:hypothetical protein
MLVVLSEILINCRLGNLLQKRRNITPKGNEALVEAASPTDMLLKPQTSNQL